MQTPDLRVERLVQKYTRVRGRTSTATKSGNARFLAELQMDTAGSVEQYAKSGLVSLDAFAW